MKKMHVELNILVPDDFEASECHRCPYQNTDDNGYYFCTLGFSGHVCPLEECEATTLTAGE